MYTVCMGRLSVYLPDDLQALMRALDLSPSALLQAGIREAAEVSEKQRALDEYLAEGIAEHGEPTVEDEAWVEERIAEALARREQGEARRQANQTRAS